MRSYTDPVPPAPTRPRKITDEAGIDMVIALNTARDVSEFVSRC